MRVPGVKVEDLPAIDTVLLSHAHMDHLNRPSLRRIVAHTLNLTGKAPIVVVPWSVSDLVSDLGFSRVVSLEWWQKKNVGGLEVTMTPAKHWGARFFRDTHRGFGGYVVRGGSHSLYHSGDSAYFTGFAEIGKRLHPEVALLPIGAYRPDSHRTVHTSPGEALQAFLDLGAQRMIPMHFGTFRLSKEPLGEPVRLLTAAAKSAGVWAKICVLEEGDTEVISRVGSARFARSARGIAGAGNLHAERRSS
jgi:L-ascorbate metabolism protein UlaG (beta-lactamase superfamily)